VNDHFSLLPQARSVQDRAHQTLMKRLLNVAVMLGGPSEERAVSLKSGAAVAAALRGLGHRVTEVDPLEEGWALPEGVDVVFLALHGAYGEDGTVQARLEHLGVPYTGCGVEASRVAFDKVATKRRLLERGLPTPRFMVLEDRDARWPMGWKPPVVLKPARQGSSVGLQMVERVADWSEALAEVFRHDAAVLMEERILGREVTAGVLGGALLPLVEIRPRQGTYDYANKYTAGATEYFCPAPFASKQTERLQALGGAALAAIGGGDYGRVDIMVRGDGEPFILEVNTLPGMTETSLFPKAALAAGLDYGALCQRMLDLALKRAGKEDRVQDVA